MRYIKITALFGVVLLILSGCGQRGPLYSPPTKPETTPVPATDTVTPVPPTPVPPTSATLSMFKGA
jgi:predicted small lipoprotein YifL